MARIPGEVLDLLAEVPLFSGCSHRELRTIASLGTYLDFPAGRVLVKEGAPGTTFFLLTAGKAAVTIGGREMATFGAGDFFGEMSLLDRLPRSATVTASTPVEALVLDAREFATLLERAPTIARKMLRTLAHRLRDTDATLHH